MDYDDETISKLREMNQTGIDGHAALVGVVLGEASEEGLVEAMTGDCAAPPQELVDLFLELESQGLVPEDLEGLETPTDADTAKHPATPKEKS